MIATDRPFEGGDVRPPPRALDEMRCREARLMRAGDAGGAVERSLRFDDLRNLLSLVRGGARVSPTTLSREKFLQG